MNKLDRRLYVSVNVHSSDISSSEDDLDIILHGTMEQRKKLRRRSLGQASSSDEDEFEKEMAAELRDTMKQIESNHLQQTCKPLFNFFHFCLKFKRTFQLRHEPLLAELLVSKTCIQKIPQFSQTNNC